MYIEQAILSVLNQSYSDFELIIVDGGSNIETQNILNKYIEHNKVHVIVEEDRGMYHARNKGILLAKGDCVCFLNTDDYYELNCFELVENKFSKSPNCNIVFGITRAVDKLGSFNGKIRGNENLSLKDRVENYIALPDQSIFFKSELISHIGLFDCTYKIVSDWDFWQRIIKLGYDFVYLNEHLANYRHYPEALTFNPKYDSLRYSEKVRLYKHYNSSITSKFLFSLWVRYNFILPIKRKFGYIFNY